MRFSARSIATLAFAGVLMPAFLLGADKGAKPSAGVADNNASDSSISSSVLPYAPMPMASMGAATPYSENRNAGPPKVELFLGYSYLRAMPTMEAGNRLVYLHGGSASLAYNFNRYLGVVADVGAFTNSQMRFTGAYASTIDVDNQNVAVITYLFGPRLSFRHERFTPFVQALFGEMHANQVAIANCTFNCILLPDQNTFAMTAGGGLDIRVRRHLAIRLFQAEYLMTRFTDYSTSETGMQNDIRLSSGLVFRFGGNAPPPPPPPPVPLTYSCSVNPASAYPGDPIAASGTAVNLDPAKTPVYTWQADGGTVTGVTNTARIDTTNAAAGSYTLKGHVSEGDTPVENADCTAPYTVKAYDAPTVSCSASPTNLISGEPSTITAVGNSPQSRPLTYSYSSTSGTVTGTGATASLSTAGATLGTVGVTCTVLDDKGQTASAPTSVTVALPVAAPMPKTSDLCSINFGRDAKRPARVDNEAKACLDEIALNLNSKPDARLAVAGSASSEEKGAGKLAAERAVNTKTYLVTEKGIDPSRITVYTRSQDGKAVSNTLIPSGATLDTSGDTLVHESGVPPHPVRRNPK